MCDTVILDIDILPRATLWHAGLYSTALETGAHVRDIGSSMALSEHADRKPTSAGWIYKLILNGVCVYIP
jgi:hypothetical protein